MRNLLLPALALLCAAAAAQDRAAVILERSRLLAEFAGQQVGEAGPEVLAQAEKIASGTVFFYGSTPVQVGLKDIDWTGKHIRHQEWPAQLNRFFHLRPLAAAYRATHDERFARAARAYIEDWLREDPYETAPGFRPGDNGLNMSIRLGNSTNQGWGGTLPYFVGSPTFDGPFLDRVMASMARQAAFLSRHLTPTGNFRISQLDTLVFTALRFPFLAGARELLAAGALGMRNAVRTQFLPDGAHVERTPGYADWMAQVAANYYLLGKQFPEANAAVDPAMVARALDYGAASELAGVNDSSAPHRDPKTLTRLTARAETLKRMGLETKYPATPPLAEVFPIAGQVFVRSAWTPGADYLAFDASTWGGGHGHLSRLAFTFRSGGRVLLADPGILSYEMSDPLAPYGKSTQAHSTLNLNGWNQSGADAELLRTEFGENAVLIQARYQGGYWDGAYGWGFGQGRGRGAWGEHERILVWLKGEYLLAIDSMGTDAGADIRNVWQFGPMEKWEQDPAALAAWSRNEDANVLVQLAVPPAGSSMQCFEGSREPLRGWLGLHGHDSVAAPLVEFRYRPARAGVATSVVLIAPFAGGAKPRFAVKEARIGRGAIQHLTVALPDGGMDEFAWSAGLALPVDDAQPFITDGTFVWRRRDAAGSATRNWAPGASYVK